MIEHKEIDHIALRIKLKKKEFCFGGNKKLKIYGTLHCKSGKRMKRENRVFFSSETEAIKHGYRPCGSCMRDQYLKYLQIERKKNGSV